ncbi:hypothetical protein DL96DRAFT_1576028 [Flagelloscypha sp. PMI_526]|nr:hypothetical protein DL96DRAFT_1576028 [Flagelloscypha sp. PMI_526]
MSPPSTSQARIFPQDLVQLISDSNVFGVVHRCWHHGEEEIPVVPPQFEAFFRPLKKGEYGVAFTNDKREIVDESQIRLIDRCLQLNDHVKRSTTDLQSATITGMNVRAKVAHAITGELLLDWITEDVLKKRSTAEVGDLVLYDDWVGQVVESHDEITLELSTGKLALMPEFATRLLPGDKGYDIIPPETLAQVNSYNPLELLGLTDPPEQTFYAISWLAVNQTLDNHALAEKQRPKRIWLGDDLSKLTLLTRQDERMQIGTRIRLKEGVSSLVSSHNENNMLQKTWTVDVHVVKETDTELDLLWQDGTTEKLNARDVHDCWPGEHVVLKTDNLESRPAVVQSVNASERTASVYFSDTGTIEPVSLLDIDAQGFADTFPGADGFGVVLGDIVLIHREGTTNGSGEGSTKVPVIGELESWVRELNPDLHPDQTPAVSEVRTEMTTLGMTSISQRTTGQGKKYEMKRPAADEPIQWIGEVTKVNLNGTTEVTLPHGDVQTYSIERLSRLSELLTDLFMDDDMLPHDHQHEGWIGEEDEGLWEEMVDDSDELDLWEDSAAPIETKAVPILIDNSSSDSLGRATMETESPSPPTSSAIFTDLDEEQWARFAVLPEAPIDHAFYPYRSPNVNKSFMGRLAKEHRALTSSLPESILVRAYEDRSDLLRSLIIGAPNTPYEDCPFVIDWLLDENFPQAPPRAHFISWTGGNGRVNPNLYEDGKVCLSILGTWSGDKSESWSASRSSLLQALVSIQGLVLTKEPYFCEPSFEKLQGTEEGTLSSRLYSERAYVLSRGFIRRALENPPSGFENELRWFYYNQGRLTKAIADTQALINRSQIPESEESLTEDSPAVPRLTGGGILSMRRTLDKLESLQSNLRPA